MPCTDASCGIGATIGASGRCVPEYHSCMQSCLPTDAAGASAGFAWSCFDLAPCPDETAQTAEEDSSEPSPGGRGRGRRLQVCEHTMCGSGTTWHAQSDTCVGSYNGCLAACEDARGSLFKWTCTYEPCEDAAAAHTSGRRLRSIKLSPECAKLTASRKRGYT